MDGHAESAPESSGTLSDLASFLGEQPETDSIDEDEQTTADETTGEADTVEDADSEQDIDPGDPDGELEEETPAPADRKIKVPERHEDGTVTEIEVTEKELIAGYERQAAFTRKTQALATRENEAVQFLTQKHEEIRSQYLSQAELTRSAIVNMAGIMSEAEMAQLANSDPAAWVAENQRQRQIGNYLNQLDQQIQGEKQQAAQQTDQLDQQRKAQQFTNTWSELQKEGIDKPKLAKIYGEVNKNYGFSNEELATVLDHRMVQVMRDAVAFRELKAQKAVVTKKVMDAPRMPSRQAQPANERIDKALDMKFKSGRAKLNDLAAFLR